jgi:hypothetical protein
LGDYRAPGCLLFADQSAAQRSGVAAEMEVASVSTNPRSVDEVFKDYRGRRAGMLKALTSGTVPTPFRRSHSASEMLEHMSPAVIRKIIYYIHAGEVSGRTSAPRTGAVGSCYSRFTARKRARHSFL